MICDICKKYRAEIRYVTRSYGKGTNLLIIENLPVVSFSECGKSHLTFSNESENLGDKSVLPTEAVVVSRYLKL